MATHAKLSASGSATWLNCPASIQASANIERKSSVFAKEGTFAHAIAELCLNTANNASHYLKAQVPSQVYNEVKGDFILDNEMCENVQIYLDYVRSFNLPYEVEVRCDYSKWVPEGFGTSDCIIIDEENKTIHVIDLKYGQGIKVYAEGNTQAQLYGLGAYAALSHDLKLTIDKIQLHIVQPRLDHIDMAEVTIDELMTFADYAKNQAQLALSTNPPYSPSNKACKWCPVKSSCAALADFTAKTLLISFDDLTTPNNKPETPTVATLTPRQIKVILDNKKLIESFLAAVETQAFEDLSSGKPVEGYKLVSGRSIARWSDDAEESLKALIPKDKLYRTSLLTITEAKKLVDKDIIAAITVKPKGSPKLAPTCDKRPSLDIIKLF